MNGFEFGVADAIQIAILYFAIYAILKAARGTRFGQVLTGVGVIAAYHNARKRTGVSPLCGKLGTLPFQLIVVIGSLAATAGSLLKIM